MDRQRLKRVIRRVLAAILAAEASPKTKVGGTGSAPVTSCVSSTRSAI